MAIYQDLMSREYIGIAREFHVNPEHCNNPDHYDTYIRQDCFTDYKQGMGVTHVFVDEDEKTGNKKIAGYIVLRGSSLVMDMGEKHKVGFPALEIAELAVSKDYERQGIGMDMVMFAIDVAKQLNEKAVGIKYMVVCADPEAVNFYGNPKLGFHQIRLMQDVPRESSRNQTCIAMELKIADDT